MNKRPVDIIATTLRRELGGSDNSTTLAWIMSISEAIEDDLRDFGYYIDEH